MKLLSCIVLTIAMLTSCEYRSSTWHRLYIKNESDLPLKVKYQTIDETGEFDLSAPKSGSQDSWNNHFFVEHIDSKKKVPPYSQVEFAQKVISLRIFRYENDTALTEIFADKPFTDVNLWDVSFSQDDEMDLHHYWLNITNEIAGN
ncbi:hypothetical protein GC194_01660 [bacterium]|nr:hypothetical protein [bacterium]